MLGQSQDRVLDEAVLLQQFSRVIAVGIGGNILQDELQQIATGDGVENVQIVESFGQLSADLEVISKLIASSCKDN